ncbi:hypothetical protein [Kitasatospora griseola]|uniref:hypothetical protein n=1 Tax=Kitasatospora griseola TaxID=2064 RepID=UPI00380B98EE
MRVLREQAATALRAHAGTLLVAQALHELTGEREPLLAAAEAALVTGVRGAGEAARVVTGLGPAAARLTPALRTALGRTVDRRTTPEAETGLALALALWRIAGEADAVVPVLASVLDSSEGRPWFRRTTARAAREAAALGTAGRPLTARLEALLDDPTQAPSAVLGLLGVADPARLDRARPASTAPGPPRPRCTRQRPAPTSRAPATPCRRSALPP